MAYPQFDLKNTKPYIQTIPSHDPPSSNIPALHYLNQFPPKAARFSKSGVPLVKEKE